MNKSTLLILWYVIVYRTIIFFSQIIWLIEIIGFKASENCISLDINSSYLIPKYNKRAFGEFIIFEI
jgi:hypothetical protein